MPGPVPQWSNAGIGATSDHYAAEEPHLIGPPAQTAGIMRRTIQAVVRNGHTSRFATAVEAEHPTRRALFGPGRVQRRHPAREAGSEATPRVLVYHRPPGRLLSEIEPPTTTAVGGRHRPYDRGYVGGERLAYRAWQLVSRIVDSLLFSGAAQPSDLEIHLYEYEVNQ
jgi:hypothetical protein